VDNKAGIYIAKFHRYQSEVVPQTPAPASFAAAQGLTTTG
jgi:hypothetical protein